LQISVLYDLVKSCKTNSRREVAHFWGELWVYSMQLRSFNARRRVIEFSRGVCSSLNIAGNVCGPLWRQTTLDLLFGRRITSGTTGGRHPAGTWPAIFSVPTHVRFGMALQRSKRSNGTDGSMI